MLDERLLDRETPGEFVCERFGCSGLDPRDTMDDLLAQPSSVDGDRSTCIPSLRRGPPAEATPRVQLVQGGAHGTQASPQCGLGEQVGTEDLPVLAVLAFELAVVLRVVGGAV
jgi:hypothetical protein